MTVSSVSSADTSIVVTTPTTTPSLKLASLTTIAANVGGTVPIAHLQDPTAGKVIGSSSGAAAVFPPGYEVGYAQITSNVSIVSTTESAGTAIISAGAITFDGAPVVCQFFTHALLAGTTTGATFSTVSLFEGSTQITRLGTATCLSTANRAAPTIYAEYRFTPSAGSHTYSVTGYGSSGTGGTGGSPPAFIRFVKV